MAKTNLQTGYYGQKVW